MSRSPSVRPWTISGQTPKGESRHSPNAWGVPGRLWRDGHPQPDPPQKRTSDWFTSSSDHFCHRGHLSLSSNVVSLEVQQHCSWLYQKADRQTPSFKSVIQSTARSMTPAKVPGRNKSHSAGSAHDAVRTHSMGPGTQRIGQEGHCTGCHTHTGSFRH